MKNPVFYSIGFRPFFWVASLFSALLMILWITSYAASIPLLAFDYYTAITWHAHEMVFAYGMAVVAGFLFTAIRNWTKMETISGTKLMLLILLWVLGRITPFVFKQAELIAFVDLLFLPVLAVFVAIPLIKAGNKRNYFIIIMLVIMALLNLLVHLDRLGITSHTAIIAYKTAFYLIIALIIVMAGRVFPMFSQNGVAVSYQVIRYSLIETWALPSYFLFMVSLLYVGLPVLTALTAILAAIIHFIRLKGWYNKQIWQVPLVAVLHAGYLFLIVGLLMSAASQYIPAWQFLALHSFSIGTLGIVTMAMMARVSLGHTGRDLRHPPKLVKWIFLLLIFTTIVRVFAPMIWPETTVLTIVISGALWALAFLMFFLLYNKIWTSS